MERNLSKNAFINALALLGGGAALIVLAALILAALFVAAFEQLKHGGDRSDW